MVVDQSVTPDRQPNESKAQHIETLGIGGTASGASLTGEASPVNTACQNRE